VQLPAGWQPEAPDKKDRATGFRLWVRSPGGVAWLGVGVGRDADETWAEFRARIDRDVRVRVLAQYPGASIRSRIVTVRAGHAVESIVIYGARTKYAGERDVYYDLLKDGVQYEFKYICPNRLVGAYVPVFAASARTISFTS
jgi:hypothetical protein